MSALFRRLTGSLLAAGGLVLALGNCAQAVQSMPAPQPMPPPVRRPLPTPAPRPVPAPTPAPTPGGGGGGGSQPSAPAWGSGAAGEALPALTWYTLEEGMSKGKDEKKPVIVVFTTRDFRGPGTFDNVTLRAALAKCEAVPVRVLPPVAPVIPAKAAPEEQKALQDKYQAALKDYSAVARKYDASLNPTMIFLAPGGEALGSICQPDASTVNQWLLGLPKALKALEDAKAKAAGDQKGAAPQAGPVGVAVPPALFPDNAPRPQPGRAEEM